MRTPILTLDVSSARQLLVARRCVRRIAEAMGFDAQSQIGLVTAALEIMRHAQRRGSTCELRLLLQRPPQRTGLVAMLALGDGTAAGSRPVPEGVGAARRLVDRCEISAAAGIDIALEQWLPVATAIDEQQLSALAALAAQLVISDIEDSAEQDQQHEDLLRVVAELRARQEELSGLSRELEDTNRGVVALYAELDDKAQRLRRADAMKSRFLSNVSHEFRTPLSSIRALTKLLLDRVDGELSREQEKQVSLIRGAAEDLAELVNDLLDLAKIEAGKTEVRPAHFTPDQVFGALRGLLRPLLVSDEVDLVFEEVGDLGELYSDEAKIAQILRNFISNALKFTERGEVRVRVSRESDQQLRFAVIDTGIGIAPENLQLIFEEFSQIENPLQRQVKGTGLGLPLCKRLAELLGGSIEVESIPGGGSTFSLIVPCQWRKAGAEVLEPDLVSAVAQQNAADFGHRPRWAGEQRS